MRRRHGDPLLRTSSLRGVIWRHPEWSATVVVIAAWLYVAGTFADFSSSGSAMHIASMPRMAMPMTSMPGMNMPMPTDAGGVSILVLGLAGLSPGS